MVFELKILKFFFFCFLTAHKEVKIEVSKNKQTNKNPAGNFFDGAVYLGLEDLHTEQDGREGNKRGRGKPTPFITNLLGASARPVDQRFERSAHHV